MYKSLQIPGTNYFMCCIGLLTTLAINVSVHVPPFVSKESVRDLIVLNISKSNLREHILSKKMIELCVQKDAAC